MDWVLIGGTVVLLGLVVAKIAEELIRLNRVVQGLQYLMDSADVRKQELLLRLMKELGQAICSNENRDLSDDPQGRIALKESRQIFWNLSAAGEFLRLTVPWNPMWAANVILADEMKPAAAQGTSV